MRRRSLILTSDLFSYTAIACILKSKSTTACNATPAVSNITWGFFVDEAAVGIHFV